jgi:hypothetical protein
MILRASGFIIVTDPQHPATPTLRKEDPRT